MTAAAAPGSDTRTSLIAAAEELFALEGIDAVSLRGIQRAAGAKNALAVQYHFGDRTGILGAILEKHRPSVETHRHALLDAYEQAGAADPRLLAAALVRPLAAKLRDPDGGRPFLRIYGELLNRPKPPIEPLASIADSSIGRWRRIARPLLAESPRGYPKGFTALRFAAAELARRATGTRRDDPLFTSQLVDLVAALLTAPASDETRRFDRRRA